MKLKLLMKDKEYQEALAARICRVTTGILVEIGTDFTQDDDTLIVTDVGYGKLNSGMIYLHNEPIREIESIGPYALHKYDSVDSLIRDFYTCFYLWTGKGNLPGKISQKIYVSAIFRTDLGHKFAEALAQELSNQSDYSVLFLPLSYFLLSNRRGNFEAETSSVSASEEILFRRLVYSIQQRKNIPLNTFFLQRYRNVYELRIGEMMNPILQLDEGERNEFIDSVASYFDIVVLSGGDSYSKENMELISASEFRVILCDEKRQSYFPEESFFLPENENVMQSVTSVVEQILGSK